VGKKSRNRSRAEAAAPSTTQDGGSGGAVGPRQPCPCGSGRRYKNCHGSAAGAPPVFSRRPFEGMPSETDVVALREFVPAATAPLTLAEHPDRTVLLCSLLPGATPAMVRDDGTIWLGLQVQHAYGDPSRDLAAVLLAALDAEHGTVVGPVDPGDGPRLQDLVTGGDLDVTLHTGFDYWIADVEDTDGSMAAALDQANEAVSPTARVEGVDSAYWTRMGEREYLRWVLPHDEDRVLDALARLHAAGADQLGLEDRMIGMFRAHGLVVPVWEVPLGTGPEALAGPLAELSGRLDPALSATEALTPEERSARSGLASRQLTIR
jgi:hypothetical protein